MITDTGPQQHLKTPSSKRNLPIPESIQALGCMDHLRARIKGRHKQLFAISSTGKYNDWSRNFTQRLNRYICTYVTPSPKGDLPTAYSFRHTFADSLKQKNIPEHIAAYLLGHKHRVI